MFVVVVLCFDVGNIPSLEGLISHSLTAVCSVSLSVKILDVIRFQRRGCEEIGGKLFPSKYRCLQSVLRIC